MLLGIHDPFLPFENLICAIFFGGIWDALGRVLSAKGSGDSNNPKTELSRNGKSETAKKKD